MGRRRSGLTGKLNNVMFFLAGVLTVVLIGVLVIGIQTMAQSRQNKQDSNQEYSAGQTADTQKQDTEVDERWQDTETATSNELGGEKWAEGIIEHNGHKYKYNSEQRIYLLMGIDIKGPVETAENSVSGGQSDAMFLLVADDEHEKLKIVSINRNTMTEIEVYDENGNSMGKMDAQICVQHGFGDGKKLSCTRTVNAVSKMFYNLPISGYISLNIDAIKQINNVVGGVQLEVLQDISSNNQVVLKKGDVVTLDGDQAMLYLRSRDMTEFGSAMDRLRRQEQYINTYINTIKTSSGITETKIESIFNATKEYMVSSVDFTELVSKLVDYEYSEDDMYTVPGKMEQGDEFEEYNIDEDEFYDLILEVFYNEVE